MEKEGKGKHRAHRREGGFGMIEERQPGVTVKGPLQGQVQGHLVRRESPAFLDVPPSPRFREQREAGSALQGHLLCFSPTGAYTVISGRILSSIKGMEIRKTLQCSEKPSHKEEDTSVTSLVSWFCRQALWH